MPTCAYDHFHGGHEGFPTCVTTAQSQLSHSSVTSLERIKPIAGVMTCCIQTLFRLSLFCNPKCGLVQCFVAWKTVRMAQITREGHEQFSQLRHTDLKTSTDMLSAYIIGCCCAEHVVLVLDCTGRPCVHKWYTQFRQCCQRCSPGHRAASKRVQKVVRYQNNVQKLWRWANYFQPNPYDLPAWCGH